MIPQPLRYLVPKVGEKIVSTPQRRARVTVEVFALRSTDQMSCGLVMVDQNYGASVTNCCDDLLPRIYEDVFGSDAHWQQIRWIYRDTMGRWDELFVPRLDYGKKVYDVSFGATSMLSAEDVLIDLTRIGIPFSQDVLQSINLSIDRAIGFGADAGLQHFGKANLRAVSPSAHCEFDF